MFKKGYETFQKYHFKKHEKEFLQLVEQGQNPKALFIGCSDSRVIPNLITNSKIGDLFVIRNVGNFVPPYSLANTYQGTASAIEYAVSVLNVSEIIVCGHTHCGACATLHAPESKISNMPHLKKWLKIGQEAKNLALSTNLKGDKLLRATEQFSIVSQIQNLLTYPEIKEKIETESLYIHGWYYYIESGKIEFYDPDELQFKSLL
jgi:carbonic anhydrase